MLTQFLIMLKRKIIYLIPNLLGLFINHTALALTVTTQLPIPHTHNNPIKTDITVQFNQAVDPASVNNTTFSVNGSISGRLPGIFTVTGNTVTFSPSQELEFGEVITVTLTAGIQSTTAVALASVSSWQFRIRTLPSPSDFLLLPLPSPGGGALVSGSTLDSRSVALGDLDQDGDLDAFVANASSQANKVWFNDSFGNFTDSGQNLGGETSYDVALGDLDNDGDLDAFVVTQGGGVSKVWLNNGAGIFSNSQNINNHSALSVALGDLDNDGDLDAFVTNLLDFSQISFNDGSGTFPLWPPDLANAVESQDVALGDIDQDGDLDAVIANVGSENKLWLNDGTGNFADGGDLGNDDSFGVALGDIDNDGDLDALFANNGANSVWVNNGIGPFYVDSGAALGIEESLDVTLGDVDGDGDLDAFFANETERSEIWLNNGSGTFSKSPQLLADSEDSLGVALGDIDDDGDLDAFIANEGIENRVHWNGDTQIRILSKTPLENAVGVATNTDIILEFNRKLDATTVDETTFMVTGSRSGPMSGTFNTVGRTVQFTPDNDFQSNELVTLVATTGIKSSHAIAELSNKVLYQPQSWSFQIAQSADEETSLPPWEEDKNINGLTPLPPTMNLFIAVKGSGTGHVKIEPYGMRCSTSNESCRYDYKTAHWITLLPQAATNSRFQFWGGHPDCVQGKLHMVQNYTCHAYFEAFYPLHLSREGEGSITVSPEHDNCQQTRCRYFFSANTEVKLTPIPAAGWQFQHWQGQCDDQGQVVMTTEQQCRAIFTTIVPNISPEPPQVPNNPDDTPIVEPSMPNDTPTVEPSMPNPPEWPPNNPPNSPVTPSTPKPPVSDLPPEWPPFEEQPPCPLIKGSTINFICNAEGRTGEDLTIGPDGKVSNVVLVGDIQNHGWLSNLIVQEDSQINGGILTGYVDNRGLITDVDFRGKTLTGGTVAGTLINNSEVDGTLIDIHLAADTHIMGGKIAGSITSDGGAQLEHLVVAADSHLEHVTLTETVQLAGPVDLDNSINVGELLTPDTLDTPYLLESVDAEQLAQLPVTLFNEFEPQHLKRLTEEALNGLNVEQFQALPQAALSGLTADNLGGLTPEIIQTFTPTDLAQITPQALSGLKAEQLGQLSTDTLATLNTEQFKQIPPATLKGLTADNMPGLSTEVIAEFRSDHLEALNSAAFVQQSTPELSHFLLHLNRQQIQPQQTERLLPDNWQVDPDSGLLIPPIDTQLVLKPKIPLNQSPETVALPTLPDLNSAFSIGGRGPSVREGMRRTLIEEDMEHFILSQEDNGILKVEGQDEAKGIEYAFIPDKDNMIQVNGDEIPIGLSQDEGGFYRITTPERQQFRVIPAPKDPVALSAVLGGGQVKIGFRGDVLLYYSVESLRRAPETQKASTVMFDPFIEQRPTDKPGIYLNQNDNEDRVVYADGSTQRIKPTVFSPDNFIQAGLKFDKGVERLIYRSDGRFDLTYRGQKYLIKVDIDVQTRDLNSGEAAPPSFTNKGGRFKYNVVEFNRRLLSFELAIEPAK